MFTAALLLALSSQTNPPIPPEPPVPPAPPDNVQPAPLPPPHMPCTDRPWRNCVDSSGQHYGPDGTVLPPGPPPPRRNQMVPPPPPPPPADGPRREPADPPQPDGPGQPPI